MLHLLHGDARQIARVRIAHSDDVLVTRFEGRRGVEVLQHQGMLDLGRLTQQAKQFDHGIGEVADNRRNPTLAIGSRVPAKG